MDIRHPNTKLLPKSINGPYCFEREMNIDLSTLEKNDKVKTMKNDMKRYDTKYAKKGYKKNNKCYQFL